jgi:hypothetical protein
MGDIKMKSGDKVTISKNITIEYSKYFPGTVLIHVIGTFGKLTTIRLTKQQLEHILSEME